MTGAPLQNFIVASIQNREGNKVGHVTGMLSHETGKLSAAVTIAGRRGNAISVILNKADLFVFPMIIGVSARSPEHPGGVYLERVIRAMSAGELTCTINDQEMHELSMAEMRCRMQREEKYVPLKQVIARLKVLASLPPSPKSSLQELVEAFEAGQQPTPDWLERFAGALA